MRVCMRACASAYKGGRVEVLLQCSSVAFVSMCVRSCVRACMYVFVLYV